MVEHVHGCKQQFPPLFGVRNKFYNIMEGMFILYRDKRTVEKQGLRIECVQTFKLFY
jgi:hypothetical protein